MTKKAKILLHFRENYVLLRFEKRVESNYVFLIYNYYEEGIYVCCGCGSYGSRFCLR